MKQLAWLGLEIYRVYTIEKRDFMESVVRTAVGRKRLEFPILFYFLNGMPLGSVIFLKRLQ